MSLEISSETEDLTEDTRWDIIFALDKSGSMQVMEDLETGPEKIFNEFIGEQKKILPSNSTFTLYTFSDTTKLEWDNIPIGKVPVFTNYYPSGMTALFDTIGKAIAHKNKDTNKENVIFVILTDGDDNSSIEYSSSSVKKLIEKMSTMYNWKFVFLGANQDAFKSGAAIGIKDCKSFNSTPVGMSGATVHATSLIRKFTQS